MFVLAVSRESPEKAVLLVMALTALHMESPSMFAAELGLLREGSCVIVFVLVSHATPKTLLPSLASATPKKNVSYVAQTMALYVSMTGL